MRFIRVMPREYTNTESSTHSGAQQCAPMTLTQPPIMSSAGLFSMQPRSRPAFREHGRIESYVCAGCGFIEWYCRDPASIPIGPEYNSELVDLAPTAPY